MTWRFERMCAIAALVIGLLSLYQPLSVIGFTALPLSTYCLIADKSPVNRLSRLCAIISVVVAGPVSVIATLIGVVIAIYQIACAFRG